MDDVSLPTKEQVRDLALIGSPDDEICELLGIPLAILHREFKALLAHTRARRASALRKKLTSTAIDGSATTLIYLAKNELGHSETNQPAARRPEPQLEYKMG